jgi:predicted nucleic acid-binding protein
MTETARILVDTSALSRLAWPEVAAVLSPLIEAGTIATCGVIEMGLLSLLRDPADAHEIRTSRAAAFPWLATEDADLRRALAVQALLVDGHQHPISWPALMIAAVAERHQVAMLHYDPALAVIAKVTGQPAEWVVPEGSLD